MTIIVEGSVCSPFVLLSGVIDLDYVPTRGGGGTTW